MKTGTAFFLFLLSVWFVSCVTQKPDNDYDVSVSSPVFLNHHPNVLFDDGHSNLHKSTGTYKPFVNLIKNDGFVVTSCKSEINSRLLNQHTVLVISNAKGKEEKHADAFTENECTVIEKWVRDGGGLLLVADHYPFGAAVENLSRKFGVHMFNGETSDSVYFHGNEQYRDELVFSKRNGLLHEHPASSGIETVRSFRGQSMSIPENAQVLLKFSKYAMHSLPDSIWKEGSKTYTRFADPVSAYGNCQGLALQYGKGRVVMLGEAAMITAQVYKSEKFGMNTPGNQNRQFALNIMRWLAGK